VCGRCEGRRDVCENLWRSVHCEKTYGAVCLADVWISTRGKLYCGHAPTASAPRTGPLSFQDSNSIPCRWMPAATETQRQGGASDLRIHSDKFLIDVVHLSSVA